MILGRVHTQKVVQIRVDFWKKAKSIEISDSEAQNLMEGEQ